MIGGLRHLAGLQYSCQPGACGTHAGIMLEKIASDREHGEIWLVLSGHEAQIRLILGLGFLIWVEGKWSLHAQRLPSPFPAPLRGPPAVRGWIS